jgi:hypothetical protein
MLCYYWHADLGSGDAYLLACLHKLELLIIMTYVMLLLTCRPRFRRCVSIGMLIQTGTSVNSDMLCYYWHADLDAGGAYLLAYVHKLELLSIMTYVMLLLTCRPRFGWCIYTDILTQTGTSVNNYILCYYWHADLDSGGAYILACVHNL